MLYYCPQCKEVFFEDELVGVRYNDIHTGFPREEGRCPMCFGDYFKVISKCVRCDGLILDKRQVCDKCTEILKNELDEFLSHYTEEEQEAMLQA